MDSPLFQLSPFVQKQFEQDDQLQQNLASNNLDLEADWIEFKQNNSTLDLFSLCRKYRKSRLALIAARDDQCKVKNHLQTLKLVSQLADLLVQHVYQACYQEHQHKHGVVLDSEGDTQELIIYALGKLGGSELNYSSDIDLVFCFTGQGESNGKKALDAQAYFQRLGRRIIQVLDSWTQDGIVYQVDMRLRPFGSAAPLVCTVDHLLNYLQTEGRDWERYAWLRARFIAGDKDSGLVCLEQIQPFIYRKYLDYGVFESLRQIKEQIIRTQHHDVDNIKLGTGGIREIEFIIQTLQLTFAGRNKSLRGNDLWLKLHQLAEFKHIKPAELKQLTSAWLFLRKLENLTQIIDDSATHHISKTTEDAIAKCMGFEGASEFKIQWEQHRGAVHEIFQSLFIKNTNSNKQDKSNTHPSIRELKDQVSQQRHPKQTKHKLYSALDVLSIFIQNNLNVNTEHIIHRYNQVIQATSKRPNYLSMLIESPYILNKLIKLLDISQYFSDCLSKRPVLLELLFEEIDESDFDFDKQWNLFQKKHHTQDSEEFIEILCQFKQRMLFLIITAYKQQQVSAKRSCQLITELAELILTLVIQQAWKDCQTKLDSPIQAENLIVISYGSLAMKTMHLDSDFDIVFVLDQEINQNNHRFVTRWIKRIMHLLCTQTYSGYLYKLDTQLRPNGNSGATVVSANNFENYQLNQAWTWELAALIKSRTVYANQLQHQWFAEMRKNALCRPRNHKSVINELNEMASKMQHSKNNHQQEFKELAEILIAAEQNPEVINSFHQQFDKIRQIKLDKSICQESA